VTLGGTITWPAVAGATSYTLYRDGASAGTVTSPYTEVAADLGYRALTMKSVGPGGTSVASNTLRWNPTALVEIFDLTTLTPGAITTITGRKAGFAPTQAVSGQRPVASATSFNGTPGLTFDGVDDCLAATCDFSAYSTQRIVAAMIDTTAALSVAIELTAATATTNGSFNIVPNLSGTALGSNARGTVGFGGKTCTDTLAAAKYCSFCVDTSIAAAVQFIRVNGVAQALTNFSASCAAGNFSNAALNIGSRNNGASLPWAGTFGGAIIFMSGTAQDADLTDAEAFVKSVTGL